MAIAINKTKSFFKDIYTTFLGSVDIPDENSGFDKYINNEEDRKIAEDLKNSLNSIEARIP